MGKSKTLYMLLNHFSKVVMYFRNAIHDFWVVLVDSIIPVTNFQFVTNISGRYDRNEEKNQIKHLYVSESIFKGCNAFPQCNSMILSGLVDSLSFLLLIFNLWLTFQEIRIEMRKTLICFWITFSKVVMHIRNAISMIFEWFSWFPIILLLIFNLWLTFQEIWSKRKIK